MLYELGDSGRLLISVQCGQHGTDGMFASGRTQSFGRTPIDVTQIGVAFTRGVKSPSSSNMFMFMLDAGVVVLGRTTKCYQLSRGTGNLY